MLRVVTTALLALACTAASADVRSYAGGLATRWNTVGWHGHDQPWCGPDGADCNPSDLLRGNLDNSIGFRFGRERDLFELGRAVVVVGAIEAAFIDSEYNLSQNHLTFFSTSVLGGAEVDLLGTRIGTRGGIGPFVTSDGQPGFQTILELAATLPLRPGAGLRLAYRAAGKHLLHRNADEGRPGRFPAIDLHETAVLVVASPHAGGASRWELLAGAGASTPGYGLGEALHLRRAAFVRLAALRELRSADTQVQLSWTISAHESTLESNFNGYPGNERSKSVDSIGLGVRRSRPLGDLFTLHYGAGGEVGNWSDEHPLLVRRGATVEAGWEVGLAASAALRVPLAPHAGIEAGVEHVLWHEIGLSEVRWGLALVLTR
ncbi:MAG TPA: hypothetical protein VNA04_07990 [Thermoanaerobaculia bacterium]|nr:hypothetical protein [Thermoanaerobaculia bacterium]